MSNLLNHPRCELNHPMVVRRSQFGKFFGCLKYPSHKTVVNEPRCINNHIMALRKKKRKQDKSFSVVLSGSSAPPQHLDLKKVQNGILLNYIKSLTLSKREKHQIPHLFKLQIHFTLSIIIF